MAAEWDYAWDGGQPDDHTTNSTYLACCSNWNPQHGSQQLAINSCTSVLNRGLTLQIPHESTGLNCKAQPMPTLCLVLAIAMLLMTCMLATVAQFVMHAQFAALRYLAVLA